MAQQFWCLCAKIAVRLTLTVARAVGSINTGEEGEEDLSEEQETPAKDKPVVGKDNAETTIDPTLLEKDRQIAEQNTRLAERDRELGETTGRLASLHQELAQIRHELAEKSSRLAETEAALRRAEEQLASRDAKLLRIREQLDDGNVQDSLSLFRQKGAEESVNTQVGTSLLSGLEHYLTGDREQVKSQGSIPPRNTPWDIFGGKNPR
ncbi:hypothetical protein FRC06_005970 [Ceratobasidium sp. 370]|nr:hypothetical protein FRC06_005970 [Ceratobasidium sp. 370]